MDHTVTIQGRIITISGVRKLPPIFKIANLNHSTDCSAHSFTVSFDTGTGRSRFYSGNFILGAVAHSCGLIPPCRGAEATEQEFRIDLEWSALSESNVLALLRFLPRLSNKRIRLDKEIKAEMMGL